MEEHLYVHMGEMNFMIVAIFSKFNFRNKKRCVNFVTITKNGDEVRNLVLLLKRQKEKSKKRRMFYYFGCVNKEDKCVDLISIKS